MSQRKYILVILPLVGLVAFSILKKSVIDGNCGGSNLECRSLGEYADYLWRLRDFSLAVLVVGILNLIKPVVNRQLLIFTVLSAVITIAAVISAPSINGSFLSPFDKKFVGQICAVVYLLISIILIITKSVQLRKKEV